MVARLFISYSRKDEAFARRLAQSLSERGADIWIDLEDIPAGMKWSSAIQEGLDSAQLLVIIISPESMASRNVEDEWQYYLDNGKPVIPVLLRTAKIHFQLSRIQYINFLQQPYDYALSQLLVELERKGVKLAGAGEGTPVAVAPVVQPAPRYHPSVQAQNTTEVSTKMNIPRPVLIGGLAAAGLALLVIVIAVAMIFATNPNDGEATATRAAVIVTDQPNVTQPPTHTDTPPTQTDTPPPTVGQQPGFIPVTANNQWIPIEKEFGGIRMVLVPAGSFTMGASDAQRSAAYEQCLALLSANSCNSLLNDEHPQTQISFSRPFWIDRYEVTVSGNNDPNDLPRNNITWSDAATFCENRGARLPAEAEWEYAAKGPDSLTYPWGNNFNGANLNYCDGSCEFNWKDTNYNDGYPTRASVAAFGDFASWVGAVNMAGNLWEWTSSIYWDYPYRADDGRENRNDQNSIRTLRGGSWNWVITDARTTGRAGVESNPATEWYGFRCARDWQDGDL